SRCCNETISDMPAGIGSRRARKSARWPLYGEIMRAGRDGCDRSARGPSGLFSCNEGARRLMPACVRNIPSPARGAMMLRMAPPLAAPVRVLPKELESAALEVELQIGGLLPKRARKSRGTAVPRLWIVADGKLAAGWRSAPRRQEDGQVEAVDLA